MKIVAFNSSPRKKNSNTDRILQPFLEGAREAGAETEMVYLFGKNIKACLGCFNCWLKTPGKCVQKDDMPELLDKMLNSDVVVFATPLYVFGMSAPMKLFIDRIVPMAEPTIVLKNGHCAHPSRVANKVSGMVIVSNCGFHELDNFDEMMIHFRAIERNGNMKILGSLLRPQGEFMPVAEQIMPEKVKAVYEAAREAGRQVVKNGVISEATQKTVAEDFMPLDAFLVGANAYLKHLMETEATKGK